MEDEIRRMRERLEAARREAEDAKRGEDELRTQVRVVGIAVEDLEAERRGIR